MPRASALALAALLADGTSGEHLPACAPAYVPDGAYASGDLAAAVSPDAFPRNYACVAGLASAFCGQAAFAPGGQFSTTAWAAADEPCQGFVAAPAAATTTAATVPATTVAAAAWSGGPCPPAYAAGGDYPPAAFVSVNAPGSATVYRCAAAPTNQFCGMPGFVPGQDEYWHTAWTALGACVGTVAAASAPVLPALGGCPGAWTFGGPYGEGDRVTKDGVVYKCQPLPMGAHCAQAGYAPGTTEGGAGEVNTPTDRHQDSTDFWRYAWEVAGSCVGTGPVVPVAATVPATTTATTAAATTAAAATTTAATVPATASLPVPVPSSVPGCPAAWSPAADYGAGDRISFDGTMYECRIFPWSGFCGQAAYAPGTNLVSEAWHNKGACSGAAAVPVPTGAPVAYDGDCFYFDAAHEILVLPWSAQTQYETGDVVRIGSKKFKCRESPFHLWCRIEAYQPTSDEGGIWSNAWTPAGTCATRGPTARPSSATPTLSSPPTDAQPTKRPTGSPSKAPNTGGPSKAPNTGGPSKAPTTGGPSKGPITNSPSGAPTGGPSKAPITNSPSGAPTLPVPSSTPSVPAPTKLPSATPSLEPSIDPSDVPSMVPNFSPSEEPSGSPSNKPSGEPSSSPSNDPSGEPSVAPSDEPSLKPSLEPSREPSAEPSDEPSNVPSGTPSLEPSDEPSQVPSQ